MSRKTTQVCASIHKEPTIALEDEPDLDCSHSHNFQISAHPPDCRFLVRPCWLPWNHLVALGWLLMTLGCSSPSEWDIQWEEITEAIEAGNIQEAKTRLNGLLPVVQQEGPRNPHYAQVIFQLGTIAQREGHDKQAESYFWEALPLWAQSVGPEHPQMAVTLSALAALFQDRGNTETAFPLLKRAVAIEEKAWGRSDPRRLPALVAYHQLLQSIGHEQEAQEIQTDIAHIEGTPLADNP